MMMELASATAVGDAVVELLVQHQFDAAQRMLEESVPSLPEVIRLECLGTMHFYRRELQDAVRCYEAAIVLAPERIIARYQYLVGTQEERAGDFVEAFKRYQAAIGAEPAFVDAYVELGGLLAKVGDFEGAAQCYRDAVQIEPSDLANHLNLIAILEKLSEAEPTRYGAELESVRAAQEEIAHRGEVRMKHDHRW